MTTPRPLQTPAFSPVPIVYAHHRQALSELQLEQLTRIYLDCFTAPPRLEQWSVGQVRALFIDLLEKDADIILAETAEDEVAGYALNIPLANADIRTEFASFGITQGCYLAQMAVSPAYQGLGLGRALLQKHIACGKGYETFVTRCRADMPVIRNLLEAEGFSIVHRYITTIAGSTPAERLVMQKQATPIALQ